MEPRLVLPGMISMTTMSMGITGLPHSILELKTSVILKRIGAAPVKKGDFTSATILFFLCQLVISMFVLMAFAYLRHLDWDLFNGLTDPYSALGFIYGNLLNIFLSIVLGFLIASFSRTTNQANAIGMLIYFPAAFLSGQFIAMNVLITKPIMNYISYIFPFRYTTMIISVTFSGPEIFTGNPFIYEDIKMEKVGSLLNIIQWLLDNKKITSTGLAELTFGDLVTLAIQNGFQPIPNADGQYDFKIWNLGKEVIYQAWETIMAYAYIWPLIVGALYLSIRRFTWSNRG